MFGYWYELIFLDTSATPLLWDNVFVSHKAARGLKQIVDNYITMHRREPLAVLFVDTNICMEVAGRQKEPDLRLRADLNAIRPHNERFVWVVTPTVSRELDRYIEKITNEDKLQHMHCFSQPLVSEAR
jgi:hypothetical protein